jgi:acetolactate synthase-1/3 small subunit
MEVLKVVDLSESPCVAHELAMVKVAAKPQTRQEIMLIAQIYDAKVVDASPTTLMLEATGSEDRINAMLAMVRPFGIRELVRTGPVAMVRGASTASIKGTQVGRGESIAAD